MLACINAKVIVESIITPQELNWQYACSSSTSGRNNAGRHGPKN